jgi:hypothetical protein
LALVHGIGLDHDFLFVRKYARLFSIQGGGRGLGVDLDLFDAHAARLTEPGYRPTSSRSDLTWAIGRLLLSRGAGLSLNRTGLMETSITRKDGFYAGTTKVPGRAA